MTVTNVTRSSLRAGSPSFIEEFLEPRNDRFQNARRTLIPATESACGFDALVAGLELGDLDRLIGRNVAEDLGRAARGPVDLQERRPDRPWPARSSAAADWRRSCCRK